MTKPSTFDIAGIEALLTRAAWGEARDRIVALLNRGGAHPRLLGLMGRAIEGEYGAAAALQAYGQAAALAPQDEAVQENLAGALDRAERPQDAAVVRFTCFTNGGRNIASLTALAGYLFDTGQTLTGDRIYDGSFFARLAMAIAARPFDAVLPLIDRYVNSGRGQRGVDLARDCTVMEPDEPISWRFLGTLAYFQAKLALARAAFHRAAVLNGDALAQVMNALMVDAVMTSTAVIAETRARIDADIEALTSDTTLAVDITSGRDSIFINMFNFAYHGLDDRPLMEKIARMFRRVDPALTWRAPHLDEPRPAGRRPCVCLVGSLEIDSVSRMLAFLPSALLARGFDLHYFTQLEVPPAVKADYPGAWHRLPGNVAGARDAIAACRPDIVMFTDLFMNSLFYFTAFSRLARVQCLWPGHPVTSGLDTIDYFISTATLERPDADADYTEQLVRLPELCTVYPRLPVQGVTLDRAAFGIAEDARLYLCAQVLYKLHPDFDAAMRSILERDPKACILLFENNRPEHTAVAAVRLAVTFAGLEDRVKKFNRLPLDTFLGLCKLADVVLDTFHFGGGNTSFQALQLALPVVTLPGRFHRGRSTYSLYQVIGFTELIASDVDDYVDLAVRTANDRAFRARCCAEIEARQGRLFDRHDVAEAYGELFAGWMRDQAVRLEGSAQDA